MALPVTLTGAAFPSVKVGNLGPFLSSGGNVYLITVAATTSQVTAHKATDPTTSFAIQDASNNPVTNAGAVGSLCVEQVSDLLHCSYQDVNGTVSYAQFNMATDAWISTGFGFTASNTEVVLHNPANNPSTFGVDIVLRPDGDIIVVYHGENPASMGGTYQEIAYSRWEGSSWTNGVVVQSTATKFENSLDPIIGMEPDSHARISWCTDYLSHSSNTRRGVHNKTLSSTNSIGGLTTSDSSLFNNTINSGFDGNPSGVVILLGKSITALRPNSPDDHAKIRQLQRETSAVQGEWQTSFIMYNTEQVGNGLWTAGGPQFSTRLFGSVAVDTSETQQTGYYSIYTGADDLTLYSDGAATNFAADTLEGVLLNSATITAMSAMVFERDKNIVYAYAYVDGGTFKYDEYVIRAVAVEGTGALATGALSLGGTGERASIGSGSLAVGSPLLDSIGIFGRSSVRAEIAWLRGKFPKVVVGSVTGTGALSLGSTALAGTGVRTAKATGDLSVPAVILASAGEREVTGSAALDMASAVLAATGEFGGVNGSGNLTIPQTALEGTGLRTVTGIGALLSSVAALDGTGERTVPSSGALSAPAAALDGTGTRTIPGTGALAVPAPILASTGERTITGVGALLSSVAVLAATGERIITGTGSLDVQAALMNASGERIIVGPGSLTIGQTQIDATGIRAVTGNGALIIPASALEGTGLTVKLNNLRPNSDDTNTGWENELGGTTNIYQSIDEETINDLDFIISPATPNATQRYKCGLTAPVNTVNTAGYHALSYRYGKVGGASVVNLTVRLVQGASTVIASWTHNNVPLTLATALQELTAPQIASITNYADLFIEFEADTA